MSIEEHKPKQTVHTCDSKYELYFFVKLPQIRLKQERQESRAVARKPRDAAAVLFGLKFADDIYYKFKSIAKLRKPGFRAQNIPAQNRT